jgi:hypothetical protein
MGQTRLDQPALVDIMSRLSAQTVPAEVKAFQEVFETIETPRATHCGQEIRNALRYCAAALA